jgi:hypothetical protein
MNARVEAVAQWFGSSFLEDDARSHVATVYLAEDDLAKVRQFGDIRIVVLYVIINNKRVLVNMLHCGLERRDNLFFHRRKLGIDKEHLSTVDHVIQLVELTGLFCVQAMQLHIIERNVKRWDIGHCDFDILAELFAHDLCVWDAVCGVGGSLAYAAQVEHVRANAVHWEHVQPPDDVSVSRIRRQR